MSEAEINYIDEIFAHQNIDEIGIIFDLSMPNIYYINKKLGISKFIIKDLFNYCINQLNLFDYTLICDNLQRILQLKSITRVLLIIKGDISMVYNYRKLMIKENYISIHEEISLLALLFTMHPKSPSGWQHRKWCLLNTNHYMNKKYLTTSEIETERELCRKMSENHPKNYFSWTHRLWILSYMNEIQIIDELFFTEDWLLVHVSDHSACNHRIQVVLSIMKNTNFLIYIYNEILRNHNNLLLVVEDKNYIDCIIQNIEVYNGYFKFLFIGYLFHCSELQLLNRPGYESLWYYRRNLFELLLYNILLSIHKNNTISLHNSLDGCNYAKRLIPLVVLENNNNNSNNNAVDLLFANSNTKSHPKLIDQYNSMFCNLLQILQPELYVIDINAKFHIHSNNKDLDNINKSEDDLVNKLQFQSIFQCLYNFIQIEILLVDYCISVSVTNSSLWNNEKNKIIAIRYCAYIIDRTLNFINSLPIIETEYHDNNINHMGIINILTTSLNDITTYLHKQGDYNI